MPRSLRGQFLVAIRSLRDPNFFQTVVLIVEHNKEGAMGLVINRPTDNTVAQSLSGHFEIPDTGDLVYIGGPVSNNALFILHNLPAEDPHEAAVIPGLYVGSSADAFAEVVNRVAKGDPSARFRVFQGCSGWGADQLEGELTRGDWIIWPASTETIFHPEPYNVWNIVLDEIRRNTPLGRVSEGEPGLN